MELTPDEYGAAVRHKLGDLLLKAKKVTRHQLANALAEQECTNERLGQVLLRLGLISEAELTAVLTWQHEHTYNSAKAVRFMLGEILVAAKVITREQLQRVLEEQRLTKRQIGEILVEAGLAKPNHIMEALRIQGKLIAASLVAVIGAATLSGCGTGASLTGITVGGGAENIHGNLVQYSQVAGPSQARSISGMQGADLKIFQDGSKVIENVPFFRQQVVTDGGDPDNTCGQAASTMVLHYWQGHSAPSYQQVVNESNFFNLATTQQTLTNYLQHNGLQAKAYKKGSINFLKSQIDQGKPAVTLLQFSVPHYVVVVGYNAEQNTIIYHDSIDGAYQQLDADRFQEAWYNSELKNLPVVGGENYVGLVIAISGPGQPRGHNS
ncbi:MAG: C39 family peptidase, partial [Cyanobacteria bacterium NC_groundwater_1444_Ag_S-0.65um_54_12]|nr:C39 family peptidase [Cyanobacteria bacterium NC_groundwater_1444_Ag_S-0.65um_54_12]